MDPEENIMPITLNQLQANYDRVVTETGETADEIRKLQAAIVDLKSQIPSPEVQAQIDTIAAGLGAQADALDALQEHVVVPPPDEPPAEPTARRR
jgi:hypothetical protein